MTVTNLQIANRNPPRTFKRKTALGEALVKRLAATLDTVEQALATHETGHQSGRMIHDARKAMKEYRALMRLIAGGEAKSARRHAAAEARKLSGARDLQACRDALADVKAAGDFSPEDADRIADTIGRDPSGGESAHHRDILRDWLAQARANQARTLDAHARSSDVVAALTRGYVLARRALDLSTPERLHDLRKRVVTHRYQISFFADLTGAGTVRARRTQKLRDVLGGCQDIETLRHHMEGGGKQLPKEIAARFAEAAEQRFASLRQKAQALHEELFGLKRKQFTRKLVLALSPKTDPAQPSLA